MNKELAFFRKLIENNGYKYTKQKELILKFLMEIKSHINADEIYEKLKGHKVGIATVYRTLKLFSELGILKEINIKGTSYYEMKIFGKKPLHIHFRCIKCNEIMDIDNMELNIQYIKLNHKIQEEHDIEIDDVDIMLKGLCSGCKN